MRTIVRQYRVDRREIAFLRFIIEAYDGAAVLTTVAPHPGIIALHIAPGCLELVDSLLDHLGACLRIEPVETEPCDDAICDDR